MSLNTSDAPSPRKPLGPQLPQPLGVEMRGHSLVNRGEAEGQRVLETGTGETEWV